jgi:hypothetical protein
MRRLAALAGILILLVLALTLLWRVYLHHIRVNPDETGLTDLATGARLGATRAPAVWNSSVISGLERYEQVKISHLDR